MKTICSAKIEQAVPDFSSSSLFAQLFNVENQGDLPEIMSF
jgi:hypothetical protein